MHTNRRTLAWRALVFLGCLLVGLSACAIPTSDRSPTMAPTNTPGQPDIYQSPTPKPTHPLPTPTPGYPFVATFEPAQDSLWIQDAQVRFTEDGLVEGRFTVVNSGPDQSTLGYVFAPSFTILIFDNNNQLVFRMRGAWNPPLGEGEQVRLSWDTSDNHIGETSGPPFRPTAGQYTVKIRLEVWETMAAPKVPDEETIAIEVP
jgi:hypothetical protein